MQDPDDEAWHDCQRGDPKALAELFVRHKPALYAYAFRCTASIERAEDVVSATFLIAWEKRATEIQAGHVLSWLYGVTLNVLRNEARSLRRHAAAVARIASTEADDGFVDRLAERLDDERRIQAMLDRISHLPTEERELVVLCWWSGLTYQQAAQAADVPVGTVRSRLARARRKLMENDPVTAQLTREGEQP